jgi:hypothetical protein
MYVAGLPPPDYLAKKATARHDSAFRFAIQRPRSCPAKDNRVGRDTPGHARPPPERGGRSHPPICICAGTHLINGRNLRHASYDT